ncbi:MAG: hypothetical protein SAqTSB_33610 [Shewanella algae]
MVRYEEKGFYFIKRELTIGSDSDLPKQRAYREEQAWDKKNEREGLALLASLKEENAIVPSITWESCQESLEEHLEYIKAKLAHESVPDAQIARMLEEYEYDINRINSFICCLFEEDEFKDDFRELENQIEGVSESFAKHCIK